MATRNSSSATSFSQKFFGTGLTFDDVLLMPAFSQVLPREVDTRTQLTKSITLNIPMMSAAMDTVTEAALAIALARVGGIGILHKNMSIEEQSAQVRKVKRSESGLIIDPVTLMDDATIGDALRLMAENRIGGIPILDKAGKLVGILTNRDLRFETNKKRKVSEVMTTKEKLITAPEGTDLKKAEIILRKYKIEKLPVVNKQGKLIGLVTYRDIIQVRSNPNAAKDQHGRLLVGAAVGITNDLLDRVAALHSVGVDVITLDSAHGHSKGVMNALKKVKQYFKTLPVIAGNVGTAAGAKALADAGADAVKVGIGPGSICTTRIVAGAGVPQLTAIMEANNALKGKVPVIADGGIRYTGDMVKALAAGANMVMMGSVFAGVEESPGDTIIYEGRKFKEYRGMGSIGAMQQGSSDRYFQDVEDDIKKFVPEGIEGRVPYKGTLKEIVYQFTGGLRAGMGYCGAKDIKALQQATFIQITNAGMKESHAHDVDITKESPNYSRK
jgi:IMP dehydrogenase